MNYDLAKELKDAGFPQKQISIIVGNEDRFIPDPAHLDAYLYVPTLEELIEACGLVDEDTRTTFTLKYDFVAKTGCWRAGFTHNDFWGKSEFGPTPTEAVARLWLALNKKI